MRYLLLSQNGISRDQVDRNQGDAAIVAEFGFIFHEVLAISNLIQFLTSAQLMGHLETTTQSARRPQRSDISPKGDIAVGLYKGTGKPFIVLAPKV